MNERWRVALAGVVAALAIPFLIFDSPTPAGGVETEGEEVSSDESLDLAAPEPAAIEVDIDETGSDDGVEIVVVTEAIAPNISALAMRASEWGVARTAAADEGLVDDSPRLPPSNTNLSLLPVVNTQPAPEPEPEIEEPPAEDVDEPADDAGQGDAGDADGADGAAGDGEQPADEGEADPDAEQDPAEDDPADPPAEEPGPPADDPEEPVAEPPANDAPQAPPQVDGRVPPPVGGPTGAQWDALRKCESTHNYQAISPSGLYRGAYQFSQQTWDWVSGIHWPHLTGIDPINAEPAWQDVMAYTLYAMRGWDQWPICGKHLL